MKTKLVTILKVDEFTVSYERGMAASKDSFPGAKPGQQWEVTTDIHDPNFPNVVFPLGVIVSTRLVTDVP